MAQENRSNVTGGNTILRLACIKADAQGESYFSDVAAADPPESANERQFPVAYWQVWRTLPGYVSGFQTVDAPKALAVMSGRLEITVSSGETRYFSAGDTFLLQDMSGKGHVIRTIGKAPASVMLITMTKVID